MEKIPTGIFGLDEITNGGFVPESTVLLSGKAGTCKTLFCSQFLYYGATKFNQPGVFVTTEERADDIKKDVRETFGWDFESLISGNLLAMVDARPQDGFSQISAQINQALALVVAQRVAIDSISMFEIMTQNTYQIRHEFLDLLNILKDKGITTLVTAEVEETTPDALSRSSMVEFSADAVIKLDYIPSSEHNRLLTIRKMRRSSHSNLIHPFDLTREGIAVRQVG